MGGRRFEKASVFLPVRVRGVEGVYFMQLDTGSPRTLPYEVPYRQLLKEQGVPGAEAAGRFATATFSGSHRPPTRTDGTAAEQVSQRGPEAEWSMKKTLHKC